MTANSVSDEHDGITPGLDRFGAVLGLSAVTIAAMLVFDLFRRNAGDGTRITATIVELAIGATLIMASRASGVGRRLRRIITALVGIAVLLSLIGLGVGFATDVDLAVFDSDSPTPTWVVIALSTPVFVIRRLVRHRRVTRQTMFGAVAAYLLIAIGFAYLFMYVAHLQSERFFAASDDQTSTAFAYFSLTTITTLGYGDLSPATDLGRLLAMSEAVIGQVYLVTFVAMIVGLFIAQRESTTSTEHDDATEHRG